MGKSFKDFCALLCNRIFVARADTRAIRYIYIYIYIQSCLDVALEVAVYARHAKSTYRTRTRATPTKKLIRPNYTRWRVLSLSPASAIRNPAPINDSRLGLTSNSASEFLFRSARKEREERARIVARSFAAVDATNVICAARMFALRAPPTVTCFP